MVKFADLDKVANYFEVIHPENKTRNIHRGPNQINRRYLWDASKDIWMRCLSCHKNVNWGDMDNHVRERCANHLCNYCGKTGMSLK